MFKLLSFFAILALAFAAPAPEPGLIAQPIAYRAPLTYAPGVEYYGPAGQLTYGAPLAYSGYPAYAAYQPVQYSKIY